MEVQTAQSTLGAGRDWRGMQQESHQTLAQA